MTPREGQAKLRKLLGANARYRQNPKAPAKELREEARALIPDTRQAYRFLRDEAEKRAKAVLAADEEYQALLKEKAEKKAELDKLVNASMAYRLTVGTVDTIAADMVVFHQKAQGDNWAEVIRQLETK